MRIPHVIRLGLVVGLGIAIGADAAPGDLATNRYELVDLAACKKPAIAPPALPAESDEMVNAQRRFVDLDGSGRCAVMDFWIERLGGDPSPGMRVLEHRFMRFAGGKWQLFETSLGWFPHALKERSTGRVYLVDAPTEEDLGDFMVLKTGVPRVFTAGGWSSEKGFVPVLRLQEVSAERADILLALARALEPHATRVRDRHGAERARIRALREAANSNAR